MFGGESFAAGITEPHAHYHVRVHELETKSRRAANPHQAVSPEIVRSRGSGCTPLAAAQPTAGLADRPDAEHSNGVAVDGRGASYPTVRHASTGWSVNAKGLGRSRQAGGIV
jgi:hypothetical protein